MLSVNFGTCPTEVFRTFGNTGISGVGVKRSCEDCPLWGTTVTRRTRRRLRINARDLRVSGKIRRVPQVLHETEHFRCWRQQEVAKIVHCGEPFYFCRCLEPNALPH
jgi:hypothetical protein